MDAAVLVDVLAPGGRIAGAVGLFAALAQGIRLTGWRSLRAHGTAWFTRLLRRPGQQQL